MNISKSLSKLALAAGLAFSAGLAAAADVTLYTYHAEPPFVTGDGKGLTHELADYLNKKTGGNPKFKVSVMPRSRVDQAVQGADFKDAVPWVFPVWFKDKDKTNYLWSEPLFPDENIVVSTPAKKIDFAGPESLKGSSFGGVLGHNYAGIDDLVKAGQIERTDANNEETNLKKVASGRVDATLLPASSANFLFPDLGIESKVYVSKTPQSKYTRHVLVSKKNPELLKQLNGIIGEMKKDPAWLDVLKKYKIKAS